MGRSPRLQSWSDAARSNSRPCWHTWLRAGGPCAAHLSDFACGVRERQESRAKGRKERSVARFISRTLSTAPYLHQRLRTHLHQRRAFAR